MSETKIPVSLVLGSGGARGLAHIGVIRAIHESSRYEICAVSGSSIGALIGGLYAAGKLDKYEQWVKELSATDVWKLLDFSFTNTGLFKGDRLMDKLSELVGDKDIADLNIAFTAVASDIGHRREVWLDSGPLFDAIRASIAIPGFFTPVQHEGCTLVDGGLMSPLPVAPVKRIGASKIMVVSLNGNSSPPEHAERSPSKHISASVSGPEGGLRGLLNGFRQRLGWESQGEDSDSAIDILSKSLEAMQDRIARYQMAAYYPDILIEIPVTACDVLDFHRADEMIEFGYESARDVLSRNDDQQQEADHEK
ncbi:patatin-like phospholipase family protein [Pseudohongiella spirulinae]|uniref:Serine protease n=1 Tax=Pseudohongiella spirulinae TaxID=1249552 RepID=A0A0S2KFA0_9GAMM|nr:patatin-like phospholipase family protein [Pseudohongiella spirulinae]ALO46853.1 serine protease [Pseudohongiella spirulinae]